MLFSATVSTHSIAPRHTCKPSLCQQNATHSFKKPIGTPHCRGLVEDMVKNDSSVVFAALNSPVCKSALQPYCNIPHQVAGDKFLLQAV